MHTSTTPTQAVPKTPQERFDAVYISSTELMVELGVSRTSLLNARARGLLPNAIVVNDGQLLVWEREPLKPYLDAWRLTLRARRRELPCEDTRVR